MYGPSNTALIGEVSTGDRRGRIGIESRVAMGKLLALIGWGIRQDMGEVVILEGLERKISETVAT
ncbi:hypothetical protein [Singulisphaera sp. GP187]|uniref:hypothetical protein n=1 Tax=Singulisphaera sp. GP187 TaxID=1882752 RepID=UPI0009412A6F|nr:hypothetical protein [Singulisphaera sp. GP187]